MTREEITRFLFGKTWVSLKDLEPYGDSNNLQPLVKRGELCKRVLWIPTERVWKGKVVGVKFTRITQYRIHPEWYPVYKRKYDE